MLGQLLCQSPTPLWQDPSQQEVSLRFPENRHDIHFTMPKPPHRLADMHRSLFVATGERNKFLTSFISSSISPVSVFVVVVFDSIKGFRWSHIASVPLLLVCFCIVGGMKPRNKRQSLLSFLSRVIHNGFYLFLSSASTSTQECPDDWSFLHRWCRYEFFFSVSHLFYYIYIC